MKRPASLAAVAVLSIGALSGCGGGGYCGAVEELNENENLDTDDIPSADEIDDVLDQVRDAADAAPDEVADDWNNLVLTLEAFAEVDGDITQLDPASFSDEQNEAFAAVEASTTAIADNVQEECDIELNV